MRSERWWKWEPDATRKDWAPGPWDQEPDKIQWIDETTDLDCLMHRNRLGAWCGYVGVPEGHRFFEKPYADLNVSVHGGLTYADFCQPSENEAHGICHVPFGDRPHRIWWFGFDCAHAWDRSPGMDAANEKHGWGQDYDCFYRNQRFVEEQVECLAAQLATRPLSQAESSG